MDSLQNLKDMYACTQIGLTQYCTDQVALIGFQFVLAANGFGSNRFDLTDFKKQM